MRQQPNTFVADGMIEPEEALVKGMDLHESQVLWSSHVGLRMRATYLCFLQLLFANCDALLVSTLIVEILDFDQIFLVERNSRV